MSKEEQECDLQWEEEAGRKLRQTRKGGFGVEDRPEIVSLPSESIEVIDPAQVERGVVSRA